MILAQCDSASQTVAAYQQFRERASRLDSMRATGAALSKVEKRLAALTIYPTMRDYIPPDRREMLQLIAQQLAKRLQDLQRNFTNQLDQQGQLGQLEKSAEAFEVKVKEAWTNYAQPLAADVYNSYRLVKNLPRVQENAHSFEQQLQALIKIATSLPTLEATIADFHSRLQKVRSELESVGDLTEGQQQFLERVNQGSATVADITPELLQWLKVQGMDRFLRLNL